MSVGTISPTSEPREVVGVESGRGTGVGRSEERKFGSMTVTETWK